MSRRARQRIVAMAAKHVVHALKQEGTRGHARCRPALCITAAAAGGLDARPQAFASRKLADRARATGEADCAFCCCQMHPHPGNFKI